MTREEISAVYLLSVKTLEKIGSIPVYRAVKMKDLNLERSEILKGYRNKEACGFEGSLIDFFCWLSTVNLSGMVAYHYNNPSIIKDTMDIYTARHPYDLPNTIRLYFKDKRYLEEEMKKWLERTGDYIKPFKKSKMDELIKAFLAYADDKIKILQ